MIVCEKFGFLNKIKIVTFLYMFQIEILTFSSYVHFHLNLLTQSLFVYSVRACSLKGGHLLQIASVFACVSIFASDSCLTPSLSLTSESNPLVFP